MVTVVANLEGSGPLVPPVSPPTMKIDLYSGWLHWNRSVDNPRPRYFLVDKAEPSIFDASARSCARATISVALGEPADRPTIRVSPPTPSAVTIFRLPDAEPAVCPACQFPSADSVGNPVHRRSGRCFPLARRLQTVRDDGSESFEGPVYGGAQPGRAGSIIARYISLVFRTTRPIRAASRSRMVGRNSTEPFSMFGADRRPRIIEPGHTGESFCIVVGFQSIHSNGKPLRFKNIS